ncbi:hypothetical protein AVEN_6833-1 [Araneus ventricosus]|uniref:Uncharacterized protein n=1 Tax=Araneus ventricosus TaxID=182803 RepID=A0A4Y2R2U6_ARAVE|nr:hypothetical protein AVEN_6833-1 [Araneus ventricosus]
MPQVLFVNRCRSEDLRPKHMPRGHRTIHLHLKLNPPVTTVSSLKHHNPGSAPPTSLSQNPRSLYFTRTCCCMPPNPTILQTKRNLPLQCPVLDTIFFRLGGVMN